LLTEIYLVVVLVIALLGGGTNKYKQILQICIKDSIPTYQYKFDFRSNFLFWTHRPALYKVFKLYIIEVKNSFMPLKVMAYSNQVTHSSPNGPLYQPPSYIYNFPYMSLQVDISASDKGGKGQYLLMDSIYKGRNDFELIDITYSL
jgi:hypothetical protein